MSLARYLHASPFVCGAAALLLSQYPELSTVELKNQIEQTAQGSGFTEELGYGVIDAAAILGNCPMAYGALKVKTNLVLEDEDDESYGVITVFSSDGVLKAYGTTGMDEPHLPRPAAWGLHCHCSLLQRRSGRLGACFPTGFCWRRQENRGYL